MVKSSFVNSMLFKGEDAYTGNTVYGHYFLNYRNDGQCVLHCIQPQMKNALAKVVKEGTIKLRSPFIDEYDNDLWEGDLVEYIEGTSKWCCRVVINPKTYSWEIKGCHYFIKELKDVIKNVTKIEQDEHIVCFKIDFSKLIIEEVPLHPKQNFVTGFRETSKNNEKVLTFVFVNLNKSASYEEDTPLRLLPLFFEGDFLVRDEACAKNILNTYLKYKIELYQESKKAQENFLRQLETDLAAFTIKSQMLS